MDLWPDLFLVHYLLQLSSMGLGGFSSKTSALGNKLVKKWKEQEKKGA